MKKTIVLALFGIFLAGMALESCKKGEGDPALSLRSRKSRLAGDWKLKSGTSTDVSGNPATTIVSNFDGANNNYTVTIGSTSTSGSEAYTLEWKIEKDGSYTSTEVVGSGSSQQTETTTGVWNFTSKIGDAKNKDHVIFYVRTVTTTNSSGTTTETYTGDQNVMTAELNTLKNKELVVKTTETYSSSSGSSSSSNSELHFEQ